MKKGQKKSQIAACNLAGALAISESALRDAIAAGWKLSRKPEADSGDAMAAGATARAMSLKHMDVRRRQKPLVGCHAGARPANHYAHTN